MVGNTEDSCSESREKAIKLIIQLIKEGKRDEANRLAVETCWTNQPHRSPSCFPGTSQAPPGSMFDVSPISQNQEGGSGMPGGGVQHAGPWNVQLGSAAHFEQIKSMLEYLSEERTQGPETDDARRRREKIASAMDLLNWVPPPEGHAMSDALTTGTEVSAQSEVRTDLCVWEDGGDIYISDGDDDDEEIVEDIKLEPERNFAQERETWDGGEAFFGMDDEDD